MNAKQSSKRSESHSTNLQSEAILGPIDLWLAVEDAFTQPGAWGALLHLFDRIISSFPDLAPRFPQLPTIEKIRSEKRRVDELHSSRLLIYARIKRLEREAQSSDHSSKMTVSEASSLVQSLRMKIRVFWQEEAQLMRENSGRTPSNVMRYMVSAETELTSIEDRRILLEKELELAERRLQDVQAATATEAAENHALRSALGRDTYGDLLTCDAALNQIDAELQRLASSLDGDVSLLRDAFNESSESLAFFALLAKTEIGFRRKSSVEAIEQIRRIKAEADYREATRYKWYSKDSQWWDD